MSTRSSISDLTEKQQHTLEPIQQATRCLWPIIAPMANVEGDVRTGGVFALYDEVGETMAVWQAADIVAEEYERYCRNAVNKCLSMSLHQVICSGMVAAPLADPPIFDGGIKLNNGLYLAFSGLRAELDRVYCLLTAYTTGYVTAARFNAILQHSPNEAICRVLYLDLSRSRDFSVSDESTSM